MLDYVLLDPVACVISNKWSDLRVAYDRILKTIATSIINFNHEFVKHERCCYLTLKCRYNVTTTTKKMIHFSFENDNVPHDLNEGSIYKWTI